MTEQKQKFTVTFRLTLSSLVETVIDATSEDEAIRQADKMAAQALRHESLPGNTELDPDTVETDDIEVFDIEAMPAPTDTPDGGEDAHG